MLGYVLVYVMAAMFLLAGILCLIIARVIKHEAKYDFWAEQIRSFMLWLGWGFMILGTIQAVLVLYTIRG